MADSQNNSDDYFNIMHYGEMIYTFHQDIVSFISFIGEVISSLWFCLLHPRSIRKRDLTHSMVICGPDGMPITMLICLLVGCIIAYQGILQMHKYGADRFLPMVVGCTIVREIGPLMVAIVATGRCGSAFAAEIATMKISEELDAMRTMGIQPARFIVIPKLYAMLIMIPLLTVVGDMTGMFGGFLVGYTQSGLTPDVYLSLTASGVKLRYFIEGIIKSFVFAVLITQVGCWCGFRTGNDAVAVGRSTTTAVVLCLLAIIIADGLLTQFIAQIYELIGILA